MIKNLSIFLVSVALICLTGCTPVQKEASTKEYASIEVTIPPRPSENSDFRCMKAFLQRMLGS